MQDLPAEADLQQLAARFLDAERRVRALVARAVDGDRRELLREALLILVQLRVLAQASGAAVERAYAVAAGAVALLLDTPVTADNGAAQALGRSLAGQLDRAVKTSQAGSRRAFRTVTADTVDDAAQTAVTGLVDRDGRRLALGGYAAGVARQAGRVAVSAGTRDALGDNDLVVISSHGTENPICVPLEGITLPADANLPPYHAGCAHIATPAGFSTSAHVAAMTEAADTL